MTKRHPSSNMEKLAKLFNDRTNPFHIYVCTGTVISVSPLQVQFGDSIILTKDHLIVAAHLLAGYKRQIEIDDAQLSDIVSSSGTTTLTGSGGSNTYTINDMDVTNATSTKITATMTYTDTLVEGDNVILIPDGDHKAWYLVGKVGTLT